MGIIGKIKQSLLKKGFSWRLGKIFAGGYEIKPPSRKIGRVGGHGSLAKTYLR